MSFLVLVLAANLEFSKEFLNLMMALQPICPQRDRMRCGKGLRWEFSRREFVTISRQNDYTRDGPCDVEDDRTLVEIPSPSVVSRGIVPVLSERDGGDDKFPVCIGGGQPVKQRIKLFSAEHSLSWSIRLEFRASVGARIEEEEGSRSAMGEAVVGSVWCYRGRVREVVIVMERVNSSGVGGFGRLIPIVRDLVVVEDVDPGEMVADGRPIRRGIHLTVVFAVVFRGVPGAVRNVDVNPIAEEEHETWVQGIKSTGKELKTAD